MKQRKFKEKKQTILQEKKLDKIHYRILIGLMIFGIGYYYFIEPNTIGKDYKYWVYIFLLPTLIGIVILGIYRKQFLIDKFSRNKGFVLWTFMTLSYLIQGLIFSYLSFGQLAKMSWDYVNYTTAKQNNNETFNCETLEVWTTKKSNYLSFIFNKNRQTINVSNQFIKDYSEVNIKEYCVEIKARKGIWNYYLLEHFEMKRK